MNQAASFPTPSATLFPIGPNGKESNQVSYQRLSLSKKKNAACLPLRPAAEVRQEMAKQQDPGSAV